MEEKYVRDLDRLNSMIAADKSALCSRKIGTDEIVGMVLPYFARDNVIAIFLRGSRADGRENPMSDVDVVVLCQKAERDALLFWDEYGMRYSVLIYDKDSLRNNRDMYRTCFGIRAIHDPYGIGAVFASKLNEAERASVRDSPKGDLFYHEQLLRYLQRPTRSAAEKRYYLARTLYEFPINLSAFNGFNLVGEKRVLACLMRDDYQLGVLFGRTMAEKKETLIRTLLDRAFEKPNGLNVLNTDFSSCVNAYDEKVGGLAVYELYNGYCRFFRYLYHLHKERETEADYLEEIRRNAPALYDRLWGLIF